MSTSRFKPQLLFSAESKRIFIRDRSDRLIDAATGEPIAGSPPADLTPVRLNNRLRRIVEAALGGLTLMAPDSGKRLEAAQAVLRSKDANALPALDQAIAKETDARVKQALIEARAAVVLYLDTASDADKIEAIDQITQRGDQEALSLLGGLPANASAPVKKAAADAIVSIQSSLAIWTAVQNTWYGLSLGSVLLLAAIGLAITFGVMGVINMAHGEMVMLGAYTTVVVQDIIRTSSDKIARMGVAFCPEERGIFASLDVRENLLLPPIVREGGLSLDQIFELFPNLKERLNSQGTKLSGGEQQMLAIARILRTGARFLMLDEPTEGLAPVIIQQIGHTIARLKSEGFTILLVEQNFRFASTVADRFYIVEHGKIIDGFANSELQSNMDKLHTYLGV